MIRAVELAPQDPLHRHITYVFVADHGGQERFFCRDDDDVFGEGWWSLAEIYPGREGMEYTSEVEPAHRMVEVRLNLDMLSALTEALIVRATGTPMAAVAGMRADMLHERSRRDELEAALIRITERALAPTMTVGRPE